MPHEITRAPKTWTLYHHYDKRGRILYVGITQTLDRRNKEHRTTSAWRHQIAQIHHITSFDTEEQARAAEREHIRLLKPLHNIITTPEQRAELKKEIRRREPELHGLILRILKWRAIRDRGAAPLQSSKQPKT